LREVPGTTKYALSILRPDRSHRILLRASRISMKGPKATPCLFAHPNSAISFAEVCKCCIATWDFKYKSLLTGSEDQSIIKNPCAYFPPLARDSLEDSCTPRHYLNLHQCNFIPFSWDWRKRFFMDRVSTKEECIVQATISSGFLFERFAFSHVCGSRGAVLRQVTNGDNLDNITTRQAAYVVLRSIPTIIHYN
jgi:hypothetical protein